MRPSISQRTVHPIEAESYRILHQRFDLSGYTPGVAAVISRIVHASADLDLGASVVADEAAVASGVDAVLANAPVVCDVEMVRSGITAVETFCLLSETLAQPDGNRTRSADAIARAAGRWPDGAIFVIGCAPTALAEVVRLVRTGELRPALVIGLPVGFVGAAESKQVLREAAGHLQGSLPIISNVGEKGGSAVAAAAFNALVRLAADRPHTEEARS